MRAEVDRDGDSECAAREGRHDGEEVAHIDAHGKRVALVVGKLFMSI